MSHHRIAIKLPFDPAVEIQPEKIVTVFHRWIADNVPIEGLPIDVADYKHVHQGPVAMLIGHEADYFIDFSYGSPGLTYMRKRPTDNDLRADVIDSFRRLLIAASALAEKPAPHGSVHFATDSLYVQVFDRINAANTAENFDANREVVQSALSEAACDATITIDHCETDPRAALSFGATLTPAPTINEMLDRLRAAASPA